ncbi:MAG: hypothetical protein M3O22_03585 [Pseudomonadota bacterium]|nr:hypothetical protein [Pseudomonadota bacterium]
MSVYRESIEIIRAMALVPALHIDEAEARIDGQKEVVILPFAVSVQCVGIGTAGAIISGHFLSGERGYRLGLEAGSPSRICMEVDFRDASRILDILVKGETLSRPRFQEIMSDIARTTAVATSAQGQLSRPVAA